MEFVLNSDWEPVMMNKMIYFTSDKYFEFNSFQNLLLLKVWYRSVSIAESQSSSFYIFLLSSFLNLA